MTEEPPTAAAANAAAALPLALAGTGVPARPASTAFTRNRAVCRHMTLLSPSQVTFWT